MTTATSGQGGQDDLAGIPLANITDHRLSLCGYLSSSHHSPGAGSALRARPSPAPGSRPVDGQDGQSTNLAAILCLTSQLDPGFSPDLSDARDRDDQISAR
ncbi:hypothetical protein RRG08_065230 [Elysia crispata]|uniref:Uncharacterized protein n=1 Tax=Elysia crispata TaxID=231223 RepID=A0AAE0YJC9_9GAST|nr:hypothetical protein RRG08_065230 [Elysia crispata]